ncbi:MAG: AraC family transcriptional regulator [Caulobacter sp.]|nr:AraC family transcriptional regulator [Caulobacter sp.]
MSEFTVAAGVARGLFNYAVARGANGPSLTQRCGLTPKELEDPDHRVPAMAYVTLMKAAQELTGDPALALHFAEAVNMSQLSVVGLLVQASETLAEGISQVQRYGRLVTDVGYERFSFVTRDDGLWVVDNRHNPNLFPELTEMTFAFLICGSHPYMEDFVKEVHMSHPAPSYASEYARAFRAPVTFDREWNAARIDPADLNLRIAVQPRYVFGILSKHADDLLRGLESEKTTRGRVEALLMAILHTGEAGMDAVASRMALSRQTLFRRLKAEGVTFETVLDGLRHQLARSYLKSDRLSIDETAYLVGFSDTTAFSRAFKRWTGVTPHAFRSTRL